MFNFVHVYLREGSSASYSSDIRSEVLPSGKAKVQQN